MKSPVLLKATTLEWYKSSNEKEKMAKLLSELTKLLHHKSQDDYPAAFYLAAMIENKYKEKNDSSSTDTSDSTEL
jgi:hypothetical protein